MTVPMGVTLGSASVESTYTVCDQWNVTKYSEPGHFQTRWQGTARYDKREVAHMEVVQAHSDKVAVWSLKAAYTVHRDF